MDVLKTDNNYYAAACLGTRMLRCYDFMPHHIAIAIRFCATCVVSGPCVRMTREHVVFHIQIQLVSFINK